MAGEVIASEKGENHQKGPRNQVIKKASLRSSGSIYQMLLREKVEIANILGLGA